MRAILHCLAMPAAAEDPALAAIFAARGVQGTIVIASLPGPSPSRPPTMTPFLGSWSSKRPRPTPLRGKTGWVTRTPPPMGWLVGYVERKEQVWFYALNMEVTRPEDLPLKLDIAKQALRVKGII